jgi:anti-anti-sigma regulatory factor
MDPSSLELQRVEGGYMISVHGPATLQESEAIQVFAESCFTEASDLMLLIDLSQCSHLDSTFLGMMIKIHGILNQVPGCSCSLVQPSAASRRTLAMTQLDRVLTVLEVEPQSFTPARIGRLPIGIGDRQRLGHHILECHRALTEIESQSQAAFQEVVTRLEAELGEDQSS